MLAKERVVLPSLNADGDLSLGHWLRANDTDTVVTLESDTSDSQTE